MNSTLRTMNGAQFSIPNASGSHEFTAILSSEWLQAMAPQVRQSGWHLRAIRKFPQLTIVSNDRFMLRSAAVLVVAVVRFPLSSEQSIGHYTERGGLPLTSNGSLKQNNLSKR